MPNPHDTPSPHSRDWDRQEKEDERSLSRGSADGPDPPDVTSSGSDDDCGHGSYYFKDYSINGEEVKGEISTSVTCIHCGKEFLAYYYYKGVDTDEDGEDEDGEDEDGDDDDEEY
jgi:hypothetical protein